MLRPGAVPGFTSESLSISDWTGDCDTLPVPCGSPAPLDSRLLHRLSWSLSEEELR